MYTVSVDTRNLKIFNFQIVNMKNKQKDNEHKPKSVKHEDKIANLLKNMQERKGRRRISIEDIIKSKVWS